MAFIGPRGSRKRPTYVGRAFMSRPTQGSVVVSGWPKSRGRTTDLYQRSIQRNLSFVTGHVARMNDREVSPLREALAAFNRSHQGLRGTASIRLEDLLTQLAFGRLFAFMLPNGRIVYSRNAVNDVSRRLDWLEPNVGSILTRTANGWLPTFACEPGAHCRLLPSIPLPNCCPPAAVQPNSV